MHILKFSKGNAKLGKRLIFSLPAGYTCPNAGHCKTFADRTTGKILDLPQSAHASGPEYRCFAAMAEVRPNVREARWHNWNCLKDILHSEDVKDPLGVMVDTIAYGIWQHNKNQIKYNLCRIHESGDFWSELYFKAWLEVAAQHPEIKFYAYTKQLSFWLNAKDCIPSNLFLTASVGGNLDPLLARYSHVFRRIAHVVYTEEQAASMDLEIDHDDSHCFGDKPFALLVHNNQRAGSAASKALAERKRQGKWTGYSG
tara:strand:+ start:76 stop:843 length:768 start_codon:yes stop_codon:yes gene_type:complete